MKHMFPAAVILVMICSSVAPRSEARAAEGGGWDELSTRWNHHGIAEVHMGGSVPAAKFGDMYILGIGGGASLGYGVSRSLVCSLAAAYHHFNSHGTVQAHVIPVTLELQYRLAGRASRAWSPWVGVGAGNYHVKDGAVGASFDTENAFGWNAGVGGLARIGSAGTLGLSAKYHYVKVKKINSEPTVAMLTVQVDAGLGF